MNEEIDDAEFYHQDFTTASDWEVFIARLEEIVHQWNREDKKKDSKDITKGVWAIREEKVDFVDVGFIFSYHRNTLVESEENGEEKPTLIPNDFKFTVYDPKYESDHSVIYQWYGLNEFITLSPIENAGITSESHIKVLLSSIQIVVSNTNCSVPMLVQIQEKWQKSYLGVYVGDGVRTNFEMVHLQSGPYHCQIYKGLQNLFQDKIVSLQSPDHINGALQNTYQLSDFGNSVWKQELFDSDSDFNDVRSLLMLPFGVTIDPITTIFLKTTWTKLLVTSDNYNPFDALNWSTYVKMTSQPIVLLSDCINEVLSVLEYNSTVYDVLGDFVSSIDHEADNPLNLLTESKIPTITTVIKRATRNSLSKIRRGSAPLTEEVLVPILYYLFPDADEETTYAYSDKDSTTEFMRNLEQQCKGFKTCKVDSLPSRLAVVVGQALLTLGGVRAVAHIWFEFVQEMRFRWEKSVRVLGLSSVFPDPRTCFLHQKLQMLNCCIERKKAREERVVEPTSRPYEPEDSFSEDDEFFDCSTDKPVDDDTTRRKTKHSLWNRPVGRLGKFENLKLIKTGDPLYIPITQEPVPKTEDQLEEDTDVLLQLGSDAQGSELRAKMMSASLLSDMESFKAANPESILEDFIRWYSPRDWIEEDELDEWGQKKGHLSSRMLISDNTWVQMWKSAKPVPANRQKRLFDDTREAEKVLHYLDSCTLSQIVEMLLPVLSHAAIYRLSEEYVLVDDVLTDSHKSLQRVVKIVEKVSRDVKPSTRHYEALIQEIGALELLISQTNSLLYKLNPAGATDEALNSIVAKLVTGHEVEIPDRHKSNLGSRLVTMFSEAQKAFNLITNDPDSPDENVKRDKNFPQASKQEFVLKTLCASPAPYSVKCLQYLRTIISKGDFRLVGAFSEDMVFF